MTLSQFISKYLNTFVEYHSFDPRAKNQCVDLVNQYIVEVWGQTPIIGTDAVDFPNKIKHPLEFIPETPTTVPEVGWIVVFKKHQGLYGDPGHIAIVTEKTDVNNLWVFEQNWPTGSKCVIQRHNYRGVVGYIRNVSSTTGSMSQTLPPNYDEIVGKASKYDDFIKRGITPERFDELTRDKQAADNTASERKAEFDRYVEKLASMLMVAADKDMVREAVDRLLAIEETKRQLEKKLDQEEKKHDQERNQLLDELGTLKIRVEQQQKENETLLQRVEAAEERIAHFHKQENHLNLLKSFIDAITKVFERKR